MHTTLRCAALSASTALAGRRCRPAASPATTARAARAGRWEAHGSNGGEGLAARAAEALRVLGREPRTHQLEAFGLQECSLDGDVLLCAATGSGKSAVYQAAAYAAEGTLTVVIQPLVELIFEQTKQSQDDLEALHRLAPSTMVGRAACGAHRGKKRERAESAEGEGVVAVELSSAPALAPGSLAHSVAHDPSLRLIYITPEELAAKDGDGRWTEQSAALQWALVHCAQPLRAWVYDEVHLVSMWGSTFRVAYTHLREACASVEARREARRRGVDDGVDGDGVNGAAVAHAQRLAVTATLTRWQAELLGPLLGMRNVRIVCGGDLERSNLRLLVWHPRAVDEHGRRAEVTAALGVLRDALCGRLPPAALAGRAIFYVTYAHAAPVVAAAINNAEPPLLLPSGRRVGAIAYSAQLDDVEKRQTLDAWQDAESEEAPIVLVTTCACGTGMNPRLEVTLVAELRLPPSRLDLWQEWGRAGRRGSPAWCVLCVSPTFVTQTLRFASAQSPAVRERLAHELVEVLGVAMLPGCRRRRLLRGFVAACSVNDGDSGCAGCDACCMSGECGFAAAYERPWDATATSVAVLEAVQGGGCEDAPASLPVSALVDGGLGDAGGLLADATVRRRLPLRLVADGAFGLEWHASGWRLRVDRARLASLADHDNVSSIHLSLPRGPLTALSTASMQSDREHALVSLHQALELRSEAEEQVRSAVRAYCRAGGSVQDEGYRNVCSRGAGRGGGGGRGHEVDPAE